ncbi:invasion associated locus B family protein [Martelella alba]|uniref:Invasion associated locus B family protein n=1 Tax=Martelella alba TaxID=2590451 RepID=A0A506UFN6_9HYPH|nr:invasion associated locus B family protein [Martelella alba]TPW31825.1 invasion associated locus B family protein [Martelella alba]
MAFAQESTPVPTPAPGENAATDAQSTQSQPLSGTNTTQTSIVKENHGAWSLICDKPPGSSIDQCALMQNVMADDRPEVGLSIAVLKTADRKSKLLRVLTPLGVLIPDGMGLYVDGNNIGKAYFSRCYLDGCYVEVQIDDDLMKVLRNGKEAIFTLRFSADEDMIGIPVDLTGFAEGYDALP